MTSKITWHWTELLSGMPQNTMPDLKKKVISLNLYIIKMFCQVFVYQRSGASSEEEGLLKLCLHSYEKGK